MNMNNTYWAENGKYQQEANKLFDIMPDVEYTDNDYMNLFITVSNIYQRIYNDGDSFADFENKVYKYILPFANEIDFSTLKDYKNEELEELVNRVIQFVITKDLTYTQYTAYVNHDVKQVSWVEKEGFRKLTSGTEGYLKNWVESFIGFDYQLV